jgi:hypothetical protein
MVGLGLGELGVGSGFMVQDVGVRCKCSVEGWGFRLLERCGFRGSG